MDETISFEHSIECPVTREFAWRYWTKVSNWAFDADIESVELDGAFVEGSCGFTTSRRAGRIEWRLTSVRPEESAVVAIPAPGAVAHFRWTFEDMGSTTRITQQASIEGEMARSYAAVLEPGIREGMRKLIGYMAEAAADSRS